MDPAVPAPDRRLELDADERFFAWLLGQRRAHDPVRFTPQLLASALMLAGLLALGCR